MSIDEERGKADVMDQEPLLTQVGPYFDPIGKSLININLGANFMPKTAGQ